MQNKEAKELLSKYKNGTCTPAEIAWLESWYLEMQQEPFDLETAEVEHAKTKVWSGLPVHQHKTRSIRLWPGIAAAAILCLVATWFFFQYQKSDTELKPETAAIVPGGNNAVLTLADGSKISLNDAANGKIASQAGLIITKTKDGQLIYETAGQQAHSDEAVGFNTISTPRGGFYQIGLPDGTRVWLNAASSLVYPTAFKGSERLVVLKGEGYFEVAHNPGQPFRVKTDRQTVTVLGTHFNISSYADDEYTRTTLFEGKVNVKLHDVDVQADLRPGEQSVLVGRTFNVRQVDGDDALAWKNNTFVFNNENLGSIMRKISRWYNVDVDCPPDMAQMIFTAAVSREKSIAQVLHIMDLTGTVHFKIEGRRITVMP